ncbi:unnamed protein product [Boreogadus saida]
MLVRSGVGGASLRVGGASLRVGGASLAIGYGSSQRFSSADAVCARERHEAFSCVESTTRIRTRVEEENLVDNRYRQLNTVGGDPPPANHTNQHPAPPSIHLHPITPPSPATPTQPPLPPNPGPPRASNPPTYTTRTDHPPPSKHTTPTQHSILAHYTTLQDRPPPLVLVEYQTVFIQSRGTGPLLWVQFWVSPAVSTAMDQQIRCCNESVRFEFLSGRRVEPTDARSHGAKGAEPGAGNGREVDLSHFSPRENRLLIGRYMLSCAF